MEISDLIKEMQFMDAADTLAKEGHSPSFTSTTAIPHIVADGSQSSQPNDGKEPLSLVLASALAFAKRGDEAEANARQQRESAVKNDKRADDLRVSAGLRFKELKDRVKAGEAGRGVSWADHCAKHIPTMTQSTVDRYIKLAAGEAGHGFKTASTEDDPFAAEKAYEAWRAANGKPDNNDSRAEWVHSVFGTKPMNDAEWEAYKAARKPRRDQEKRREQNAKAQAKRREKSANMRQENGGAASASNGTKADKSPSYHLLASLAKVMTEAQLTVACVLIEEKWPGITARAQKAKADRGKAGG